MTDSLYSRLQEYSNNDCYPFHMPGHKRNLLSGRMPDWYSTDITEIDEFDNLHQPNGILLQSQQKAAKLYGSEETFFLINGSTAGILSAVSAAAGKEKRLIICRNSHMSVYNSIFLNDLAVGYLYPEVIGEYDLAGEVTAAAVEKKIKEGKPVAAVMITSPTYEGVVSDVRKIAETVHRYGIPLIVDQAHGAHFGFHPGFPEGAVRQGADIVIHSVHKTLPAPTQTALLHVNGSLADREALRRYLRIYQSSSPSYPLMAGIDTCIDYVRQEGRERLADLLRLIADFGERMKACEKLRVFQHGGDPSRLVLSVKGCNISGKQLYDLLRKDYHLQMEMAAGSYCLAILTMMDTGEGLMRLAQALREIDQRIEKAADSDSSCSYQFIKPKTKMRIREAVLSSAEALPLEKAEGRLAAEYLFLYPPGIPILVPGEVIEADMIHMIKQYQQEGLTIHGCGSGKVRVIKNKQE